MMHHVMPVVVYHPAVVNGSMRLRHRKRGHTDEYYCCQKEFLHVFVFFF